MYQHCKRNNLREVWAYLWNSWYRSSRWHLWARAENSKAIPRKRTTMMVEALWRNLKRLNLYMFNRPRVDLVVHTIVTHTIPAYRQSLSEIIQSSRPGRAQLPSHFQAAFKRAWNRLESVQINGTYSTDISKFTCDCGAQKYHAYALCKHLVQAVPRPIPASWWTTVRRSHTVPFYMLPQAPSSTPSPPSTPPKPLPTIPGSHNAPIVIESDSETDMPIPSTSPMMRSSSPVCSYPLPCLPCCRSLSYTSFIPQFSSVAFPMIIFSCVPTAN